MPTHTEFSGEQAQTLGANRESTIKTVVITRMPTPHKNSRIWAQSYDLTVFKVKWGNLTLKIYDKGGRVLRIEVVAHNVKDLRSGKILDKLPELLKRMREMLVRFLGTVQAAHVAFLDEGAFERWSKPTQRGTRRLAGIDLNKVPHRRSRPAADETVLRCHRVVGTEVGLRLVQLARNKVGPGTPGAPQTVAKGHSGPEHAL